MSFLRTLCHITFESPVGRLHIQGDGEIVTGLYLPDHKGWPGPAASSCVSQAAFRDVREQLAEYFAGERQEFNVPIRLEGTPFQRTVWQELERIPFGRTITYAELARRMGARPPPGPSAPPMEETRSRSSSPVTASSASPEL